MNAPKGRDVVVAVASAGGIGALRDLLARLPADLPAAILVVLHVSPYGGGTLPRVLQRPSALPVSYAEDGGDLTQGRVYVAPPNRHLLLLGDTMRLSTGPRQNGHRPAADSLLFSAALAAGPRVTAVVLSGALDDGAAGGAAVRRHGGLVLVQEPAEAPFSGMPDAALEAVPDAPALPLAELAVRIEQEAREYGGEELPEPARDAELERRVAWLLPEFPAAFKPGRPEPEGVSCPECGGPIFLGRRRPHEPGRYECVVGHAWTGRSLLDGQAHQAEWALEQAARQLEERRRLNLRLEREAAGRGHHISARKFAEMGEESERALSTIRRLIVEMGDRGEAEASGTGPEPG
ncbi:chemotaxis protein CheB [Spirillospora sp. NPDC029432]|uniref:chemotaxis protein CheB n=1 Tax=Spirillospora sp. NPDC029432 TaxID=3154599 RepID=UPI0034540E2A